MGGGYVGRKGPAAAQELEPMLVIASTTTSFPSIRHSCFVFHVARILTHPVGQRLSN